MPPVENQPTDADKKIREWEKVNGIINPELLADLKTFAVKIDAIKKLDEVAEAAADTSIIKMLGMFRFYSPFAHVEKKFFAQLTRAVDEAKAKKKAWDKHVRDISKYNDANLCAKRAVDTSKKPTDFEYSLAAIKPRLINEKIDSYSNAAKREHKKWLVQHQCDELNAKRNAEKQIHFTICLCFIFALYQHSLEISISLAVIVRAQDAPFFLQRSQNNHVPHDSGKNNHIVRRCDSSSMKTLSCELFRGSS